MRFGIQAMQAGISWDELLSLCQELDRDSGYEYLWTVDHFVAGPGTEQGSEGPCLEGWTALAALAMATSRVRLGVMVTGNTYRHPSVLAKMATTVDHISGGRLEFGLGAAWHAYEHRAFGIPFYTVRERLERLDEAARLVRLLWTEERPSFEGRYYHLEGPPYNPPNVQSASGGHPPITIGGGGERRTLRTVARYADATNVPGTPDEVARKYEVLRGHCRNEGRNFDDIRRSLLVMLFMTEDPGFQQLVVQGVRAFRGGSEEDARRSVLMGSVDEVKSQLREFAEAGVQEVVLQQFPRLHRDSLLRFSREIIPEFR